MTAAADDDDKVKEAAIIHSTVSDHHENHQLSE